MGEVLVSFWLMQKRELDQPLTAPKDIHPHLRRAWIDVHVIGLRNLLKGIQLIHPHPHTLTYHPPPPPLLPHIHTYTHINTHPTNTPHHHPIPFPITSQPRDKK